MKWVLVAIVLQTPVKTDLVFNTLDACLLAEGEMRTAWANIVNAAVKRRENAPASEQKQTLDFVTRQMPWGTCVPT